LFLWNTIEDDPVVRFHQTASASFVINEDKLSTEGDGRSARLVVDGKLLLSTQPRLLVNLGLLDRTLESRLGEVSRLGG